MMQLFLQLKEIFKLSNTAMKELIWDQNTSSTSLTYIGGSARTNGLITSSFISAITKEAFNSGCHYWEIRMDANSVNELKAGVTTTNSFNKDRAFSDYAHGYAYYGIGQLRNGSDCSGIKYGRRWNKEEVLGVYLDMNRGTLSFSLSGDYLGVAYQNDALKKGPIWPAVAILNTGGFHIRALPIPAAFTDK